ncbi:MAG: hypothetical protein ACLQJR_33070 [Stellaceae bacterium]
MTARAQLGPPVRLLPPAPGTGPALPPPPPAPTPAPAPRTDGSIRATPLAPVDAAWMGALPDSTQALPGNLWQGTPRSFVAAALPQLQPSVSPALQSLAHRLLLSNAAAPPGQDPPDRPSLAALRVERLIALGEIDGALAVLDALPAATHTDELDHQRVQLSFAKNDIEDGCRRVQEDVGHYQGTWWDRALIACQALAGDQAKAALGLSLLREQKAPPDAIFDALVEALGGHAAKIEKLPEPTPILVTLMAAAKLPLPPEAVAAADLATLRAWAGNEAVPPLQRLGAAERAVSLGALPPAALADLYAKVEFRPEELGQAIKQGKAPASPRDRALLFQVARSDPAAAARATALKALLADARKRGDLIATARVVAPILADLPAGDELAPFAPDAVRALLAAGRGDAAAPWLASIDPAQAPLLLGLMRLASADLDPTALREAAAGAQHDSGQEAMLLALAQALGQKVSPTDWAPLIAAPAHSASLPSVALWLDREQAASGGRLGETVLTTLILARQGEHLAAEPIIVSRAVAALKAVGLAGEARALAIEAALAAGI